MNPDRPDFNSFETTVSALFSRVRGHIVPGAHRMLRLLQPETLARLSTLPTVLVAGTNGKGTTCSLLEQTFRDSKFKTGLYTSPHIVCPTERIRIGGHPIARSEFLEVSQRVFQRAQQHLADATFFELMTTIAFEYFVLVEIEILVCEVGLGGRLDSTNITSPTVSVLTSVGLDHTEWLGVDEESIAREKAFISRRNRTLVVGHTNTAARNGINSATQVTGAATRYINDCGQDVNGSIPLAEATIEEFARATGLKIPTQQVSISATKHFWPGRFDFRKVKSVSVIFDAAHNSHGVEYFLTKAHACAHKLPRPWILVYASLADKDWEKSILLLNRHFDAIYFTETQSTRSVKTDLLMSHACSIGASCSLSCHSHASKALESSLEHTRAMNGTMFVLGSITLIGESFEHWEIPVFSEQEKVQE